MYSILYIIGAIVVITNTERMMEIYRYNMREMDKKIKRIENKNKGM